MHRINICLLFPILLVAVVANSATIEVISEEIGDYDATTGVGCEIEKGGSDSETTLIICKSKVSDDYAWNAATYRAKNMCLSQKFSILFNRPPSLPTVNGIHAAQMEIKCIKP